MQHNQHVQAWAHWYARIAGIHLERAKEKHDGTWGGAVRVQRARKMRDVFRSRLRPPQLVAINPDHR